MTPMKKSASFDPSPLAIDILTTHDFITFWDTNETYFYNGGVYRPYGEALISEKAHQKMKGDSQGNYQAATRHKVNEIVAWIKRETLCEREKTIVSDPMLINLQNGILDLKTNTLLKHEPSYHFINALPAKYDPDATCPAIMTFLNDVLHQDDIPTVQEAVGYCLYREYLYHKSFMLAGKGGNGKSKLLSLIQALLGAENCSSVTLQSISYNRFAAAQLYGKMANICADLPSAKITNSGTFKTLTGGDRVSAEKKGCNPFEFVNYAKLFFSANAIPITDDLSNAYFRRWIIIDFPNTFEGTEKNDPKILEKLTTPEELSGFLNWALEGLKRLLMNDGFSNNKTTEEVREDYVKRSDPEKAFAMDCLVADHNGMIPQDTLYSVYVAYCDKNKLQKQNKVAFFRDTIPKLFAGAKKTRLGAKGERYYAMEGVRLRTPEEADEDGESYISVQDAQNILDTGTSQSRLVESGDSKCTILRDQIIPIDVQGVQGVQDKPLPPVKCNHLNTSNNLGGELLQESILRRGEAGTLDTMDTGTTVFVEKAPLKTVLFTAQKYDSFVGIGGHTYGPFLNQDVASLPEENARVIVEQGAALYADFPVEPDNGPSSISHPKTAQHARLLSILEIVKGLEKEYGTAKKAEILGLAQKNGIPEPEAEKAIEKLKLDGYLFEPKFEVYKTT